MSEILQHEFGGDEACNRITDVVVFTNEACLKRRVQAKAQRGLNRFFVEVRAFAVDVDSAQANIYGEGKILSVQYKEIPVKERPQEEIRELEERKDQLARGRKVLQNQKEILEKKRRFLDSMIGLAEIEIPKEVRTHFPKTENLQSMLQFLGENYQTLTDKTAELELQVEDLDKEIFVLEKKLKQMQRPKDASLKGIEVLFESYAEQEIEIEVSYVAGKAFWEPVYKVDVPLDLSSVSLTMFARIRQKTGEQWKDVKLAVSNAIPLRGVKLPEANSWFLNLQDENLHSLGVLAKDVMPAKTEIRGEARRLEFRDLRESAHEDEESLIGSAHQLAAEFVQAKQKELPLAFEYELPQIININSGGGETMLPLFTKNLQGDFFVYAVPRHDPLAYLVCRTASDSAILAGRLNIQFGGRFVGGTALSEKKAGEDLLINLGAERGVKVRLEKATDKLTETFFGMVDRVSSARELTYRILIENMKEESVHVRLLDSIPVSKVDRIQIKDIETLPEPTQKNYQEREGVMLWDLQVKSKAVQEIRTKFFVKHPKDNPPYGL